MSTVAVTPPRTLPSTFKNWDSGPPASLPANFSQWDAPHNPAPPVPGFLDTLRREASSAGSTIASVPSSLYHAVIDPPTQDEIDKYGKSEVEGPKRVGLVIGRLMGAGQIETAAQFYKHFVEANPDQRNLLESEILSVAPEAFGSAAGTVVAGKLVEGAPGAAKAVKDAAPGAVESTTNAVRAGVRGANKVLEKAPGAVGASAGAAVGAATHFPGAAELGAGAGYAIGKQVLPKITIPGESFGLPKRVEGGPAVAPPYEEPPVYPGAPLPKTPLPEQLNPALVSGSRSLPGQISPERIFGPRPTPAAPIPPREGLMLQGEVAPATAARDTSPKAIQQKLEDALGGKKLVPGVSLRDQLAAQRAAAEKLPTGFTPVNSSAIKGYKYDPATQQFSAISSSGQVYTHAEVTPEDFQAFQYADSKGKAWNTIRDNHVLTMKNGRPVKPVVSRTETPEPAPQPKTLSDLSGQGGISSDDLTQLLQQSLQRTLAGK